MPLARPGKASEEPAQGRAGEGESREQQLERELDARNAVGEALRDWESFEQGSVVLLRRLASALGHALGELWVYDREVGRLRCRAFWSAEGVDARAFEAAARGLAFEIGQGLPGRAWESREPVLIDDVRHDPTFIRSRPAGSDGLGAALAFPALTDSEPIAVVALYSLGPPDRSERFLSTLRGIGRELGDFLGRRRGQLERRVLSTRELEVLRLAAEGNSRREIADQLTIGPATVKTHFEHIYRKLGVGDRTEAVALALRMGLIEWESHGESPRNSSPSSPRRRRIPQVADI
jgi:DNA-binding CsgD family transcriptional regulator